MVIGPFAWPEVDALQSTSLRRFRHAPSPSLVGRLPRPGSAFVLWRVVTDYPDTSSDPQCQHSVFWTRKLDELRADPRRLFPICIYPERRRRLCVWDCPRREDVRRQQPASGFGHSNGRIRLQSVFANDSPTGDRSGDLSCPGCRELYRKDRNLSTLRDLERRAVLKHLAGCSPISSRSSHRVLTARAGTTERTAFGAGQLSVGDSALKL